MSAKILLVMAMMLPACGARSTLESGEARPAPVPGPSACAGSPAQPIEIAEVGPFDKLESATAITVTSSAVYYSVNNLSNEPLAIYRVPIAGGSPASILDGASGCVTTPFGYGQLVNDGQHLFTLDEEQVSICTGSSLRITAVDLATGMVSSLPNPVDPAQRWISQVRATRDFGVLSLLPVLYFDPSFPGTTLLARWDGANVSTLAEIPDVGLDFVVAADQAFIQTSHTLYAVPIAGAPTAQVIASIDPKFIFAGANQDAIFYSPDGTSLVRRDIASGATQTLVPSARVFRNGTADPMWVDDDWLYFIRDPELDLARVPATGGPVEVISPDDGRDGVSGVTSDACNIYWLARPSFADSKPSAVFMRRR